MMSFEKQKKELVEAARMLFDRRTVSGVDGVMAWRVGRKSVLLSSREPGFGLLKMSDVKAESLVGHYKNALIPEISGEFLKEVFRQNPEIRAVIHSHPRYASILGLLKESPPPFVLPELERRIGRVRLVQYSSNWAEEVLTLIRVFPQAKGAILIENLGILIFAGDLTPAALMLDSVEQLLEIAFHTRLSADRSRKGGDRDVQPVEEHLTKVYLEVTTRCNFSCTMCLRKTGAVPMNMDMPLGRLKKLASQLAAIGTVREVILLGYGEMLCHPRALEVLRILKAKGFRVTLVTNGQLLNPAFAEDLVRLGLDRIFVSIEGGDHLVHQKVREGSDFNRIVGNLKHLERFKKDQGKDWPEISLETMVTIDNARQVRQILKLADEVKAKEVLLTNLLPYNAELAKSSLIGLPGGKILRDKYASPRVKVGRMDYLGPIRCKFIAEGAAFISVEGDVSACLVTSRAHSAYILGVQKPIARLNFGNVFKTPIKDIWNSEAYGAYRQKFRYFDFPDCFTCSMPELCLNRTTGEHDCFHSESPCSDCLWAKDIVLCP
jgi:MoaA/NifB/PqqE/SkfB family radical SAM enzyme/ribulose-5-phosphate 4-epimerase/fuculose-1-phosphate aldolase